MKAIGRITNTMDKDSTWIPKGITSADSLKITNQKDNVYLKKEMEVFIKGKCKKY